MAHFARVPGTPPRVYGHRGTRRGAPENSLAAMRLALLQGADGIELDVRSCATGEPVVVHDPDLARVAGVPLRVAEAGLAELRAHGLAGGERIPLLDEALALVLGAGRLLNVELKADLPDPDALVRGVARALRGRSREERTRILCSSFSATVCRALVLEDLGGPVALLADRAPDALPDGVAAVHLHHACATPALVGAYRRAGLTVNCWTVNDAATAGKLAEAEVDGIITDDVPLIRAHFFR